MDKNEKTPKVIEMVSTSIRQRVLTPPKLTIPLLESLIRAHLVIRFRFYDHLRFHNFPSGYLAVFNASLKNVAKFQMMLNKSD